MAYLRLKQPLMADLVTEYRGSSGDIDEEDHIPQPQPYSAIPNIFSSQLSESTLARSKTIFHARAKSIAAYIPRLSSVTPVDSEYCRPISRTSSRPSTANKIFENMFYGESAPVRIGAGMQSPKKEESEFITEHRPSLTERPRSNRSRKTGSSTDCAAESPFKSWFSRKSATRPFHAVNPAKDEILSLDIQAALFPDGPTDSLSPHAFNSLLLNATALAGKMKAAYQEKATYLADLQPELDAQREETEEVETRSRHLKMQLEDMCRKAEEQDRIMHDLADELAAERLKGKELEETITGSIRLVRSEPTDRLARTNTIRMASNIRSRRKHMVVADDVDSGFESGTDTASEVSSDCHDYLPQTSERRNIGACSSVEVIEQDSDRWMSAAMLRQENQALRRQLAETQESLQGCIDLVGSMMNSPR